MGRAPCCDKANVKKGPWSPEEDAQLKGYIEKHGTGGNWIALPQKAGLRRCGKSCRLRWLNYLRPNIKHGEFSDDEDRVICSLFASIGSRWSIIAAQLPGRTDNDIKNYWNTKLKKKLLAMALVPSTTHFHKRPNQVANFPLPSDHSLLQNPSPYPQMPPAYECGGNSSYYSTPFTPFTPTFSPSVVQDGNFSQVKDGNNTSNSSVLIFGGEASCCSSDGSCITNQISHAKEDHVYFSNGVVDDQNHFLITDGSYAADDYSIEDIKQLISSTSSTAVCNNLNFLVDEIKTEERSLYF